MIFNYMHSTENKHTWISFLIRQCRFQFQLTDNAKMTQQFLTYQEQYTLDLRFNSMWNCHLYTYTTH